MAHLLTSGDGLVTDPNKVRAIRDIPAQNMSQKEVKSMQKGLSMSVGYLPSEVLTKPSYRLQTIKGTEA